jgi:hypothetical protein
MEVSYNPTEEQLNRIGKYLLTYAKNWTKYSTFKGGKGLEIPISEFIDGFENSIFLRSEHDMRTDELTHRFGSFSNEQQKGVSFTLSNVRKPSVRKTLSHMIFVNMVAIYQRQNEEVA